MRAARAAGGTPGRAAPRAASSAHPIPRSAFGQAADAAKRSINLALSVRGQAALRAAGVLDAVMAHAVPMPARAIHPPGGGRVILQAYGRPGEAIYSVSRTVVNCALLDAAAALPAVRLHFSTGFDALAADGELTVARGAERRASRPALVVGADGAFSAVRAALMRAERVDFARRFIPHAYKEIAMPAVGAALGARAPPPAPGAAPAWALPQPHALHIWPRGDFMLIALPNPDGSFTATLFAPWATFERLDAGEARGEAAVAAFFAAHFADAAPLLPALAAQWAANPASALVEVRVSPWAVGPAPRVLLVGDAAHATVPFYGQGMNAALEDCLCFAEALDARADGDARAAAAAFAAARGPAGAALCDLSMENYAEMSHKTASAWFRARAALERALHAAAPRAWVPKYSLVTFSRVPYDEVVRQVRRQDAALDAARAVVAVVGAGALAAAAARAWAARARA